MNDDTNKCKKTVKIRKSGLNKDISVYGAIMMLHGFAQSNFSFNTNSRFVWTENAVHKSDWKRKPVERISGIRTIQNGSGGNIRVFSVYLPPQNKY